MTRLWAVVALLLGVPLLWALLGAPDPTGVLDALGLADPDQTWAELAHPVPPPSALLLGAVGVGALLAVGPPGRITQHIATTIHEVGHALTAAALGGRVRRITTSVDGSGLATTYLPAGAGVRRLVVTLAGYLAPGVLGLACVRVALAGYSSAWLTLMLAGLAVMLVLALRSAWAMLVAVACLAAGGAVLWGAPAWGALVTVGTLAGVLLTRAVLDTVNQHRVLAAGGHPDAAIASDQTGLPAGFFATAQSVLVVALAAGAVWFLLG